MPKTMETPAPMDAANQADSPQADTRQADNPRAGDPQTAAPSDAVWFPERIVATARAAAFVVPPTRTGDRSRAGLWFGPLDGAPGRIAEDEPATNLAFDADAATLAYAVSDGDRSALVLRATDGTELARIALPGVAEAVRQVEPAAPGGARACHVLIAEPGADTASLTSGKPLRGEAPVARSSEAPVGWRRVWRVELPSGRIAPVTPARLTVWQFDQLPDGRLAAVTSDDPSEAGWYHTTLTLLGPSPDDREELHVPEWTVGAVTVNPAGTKVAFIEGWTSDRGLDTGEVRVLDLATRELTALPIDDVDVTWLGWRGPGAAGPDAAETGAAGAVARDGGSAAGDRLWFAGWRGLGMAWGNVAADGAVTSHAADAALVNSRWHPEVVPIDAGRALTGHSTETRPPEVARLDPDGAVTPWSTLNAGVDRARGFTVEKVRWRHAGMELDGLLAVPTGRPGPHPLVVEVHGGPSLAHHHAWPVSWAETLATAGHAMFLPNPIGGPGHGQPFGRANLGDPAGVEFDQVLAGVDALVRDGRADGERVAVMGASYGGYLSAWAVARGAVSPDGHRLRGGVVIAGISNLISCWGTANNAPFYDRLCGGKPGQARPCYLDRSPITHVGPDSLPTLILHGEADQCVPVSQARELYAALADAGRPAELVIYPGEGHQTQAIEHVRDQRARILAFLARIFS
ncbi:MAG: prolyl oligopeptidase family serine peptidase [Actinomycetia bacterium]|nr:prolyl oligopeptidase family serine peptidase [Actinomycetes bacterium]